MGGAAIAKARWSICWKTTPRDRARDHVALPAFALFYRQIREKISELSTAVNEIVDLGTKHAAATTSFYAPSPLVSASNSTS